AIPEVLDSAACAGSPFIVLAGMLICGTPAPTKTRIGTALVWLRGNSGMRRVAKLLSFGASKRGGAVRLPDGYGRALRSTIEFRYSAYGTNTEAHLGRRCSIFGACLTSRSSIATPTP